MLPITIFLLLAGVSLAFPTSESAEDLISDTEDDPVTEDDTTPIFVQHNDNVVGTDGDDIFEIEIGGAVISAGAGNDIVFGPEQDSFTDQMTVYGGAGDDTIDVSTIVNVAVFGEDGDDTIFISGHDQGGAGYVMRADGGAGDDQINADVGGIVFGEEGEITGGDGEDTFFLNVDTFHPYGNNSSLGELTEIAFSFTNPTEGVLELASVLITDFESGEDKLVIDPTSETEGFTFSDAVLDTATEGESYVILFYEPDDETVDTVAVHIDLNGAHITEDDITFEGEATPTLVVV